MKDGRRWRVRLILWNPAEAAERAAFLEGMGHSVDFSLPPGPVLFRELRRSPPRAVIIDLGRLPSQGRDVALSLRRFASTRAVPLVFIEGDPEKTARVRDHLPDAIFTSWEAVRQALSRAVANPPADPVVPASAFAGYAGASLAKKLGIKEGMKVALVGAPRDFGKTLGELPQGVVLRRGIAKGTDLVIWYVRGERELEEGVAAMAPTGASLWIAWRKKGARRPAAGSPGPTEKSVRAAGLAAGLVDYKICAIDETWSALLFARRKHKGP